MLVKDDFTDPYHLYLFLYYDIDNDTSIYLADDFSILYNGDLVVHHIVIIIR